MDLINNLLYTSRNITYSLALDSNNKPVVKGSFNPVNPEFTLLDGSLAESLKPLKRESYFSYNIKEIEEFCSADDPDFLEKSIQKHWADIVDGRSYTETAPPFNGSTVFYSPFRSRPTESNPLGDLIPPYHLIYAYLVENTRCVQIFEKLLYLYMHDEKLNKATTPDNRKAFQWMINTEDLFFKYLPNTSYRNIKSDVRQSPDATRRNAYYRMFGMDLAFGDPVNNSPVNYFKAEFNNQSFIQQFERFLSEVWQAYVNASNTSGANTTDMFTIVDTAQKIQEMLMARRTTETNFNNYRYFNLSREEYSSVVMMSWLFEVLTYDSPLVNFLRCNGNTPGERLINIGNKVGLPAHSKSEGLFDIAPPMNTLLRRIELGDYNQDNATEVEAIIKSQKNDLPNGDPRRRALDDLLLIINNWEKATGHRIKNPATELSTAGVKSHQNGSTGKKPAVVLT